jgi:hypothetical protein
MILLKNTIYIFDKSLLFSHDKIFCYKLLII